MNEKVSVPISAEITEVKGLKQFSEQLAKSYVSAQTMAIRGLQLSAIREASKGEQANARLIANYERDIRKKENLLKFVSNQSSIANQLLGEMEALRASGLSTENATEYVHKALAARSAFRAFTGRDIVGMMDTATRTAVSAGQETLNLEVNAARAMRRAGPLAKEAKREWLAFIGAEQFGGDLQAYLEDSSISRRDRLFAARDAQKLLSRAYGTRLKAGLLTGEDQKAYKETKEYLQKFVRSNEGIEKATSGLYNSWKTVTGWVAAGSAGIALGSRVSNKIGSIYGDTKAPFTQTMETLASLEQSIGGVVGAAIGGAFGTLAGPIGTAVGASVGGAIGSFLGGEKSRELQKAFGIQGEAAARMRYNALYSGRGNNTWARMVESMTGGTVSQSDVEGVIKNAQTFMGSMAYGKISDDQWIALSNMPNLFHALTIGADEETIFEAYRKDLKALPAGMGQLYTQMLGMGFNENIRGWAMQDKLWGRTMRVYPYATDAESRYARTDWGFVNELANLGATNIKMREDIYASATRKPGLFRYSGTPWSKSSSEMSELQYAQLAAYGDYNEFRTPSRIMEFIGRTTPMPYLPFRWAGTMADRTPESSGKYAARQLNIIVGGETTTLGTVLTNDEELAHLQNFIIGAI